MLQCSDYCKTPIPRDNYSKHGMGVSLKSGNYDVAIVHNQLKSLSPQNLILPIDGKTHSTDIYHRILSK